MTIEDFLPNDSWMADPKTALNKFKGFRNVAGAAGIGAGVGAVIQAAAIGGVFFVPGIGLLVPLLFPMWAILIKVFVEQQKAKKISAIMNGYPDKYTKEQLNSLYDQNKEEFNLIFVRASDEWFRKYIQEQTNHKLAQELIVKMQERISEMQKRLEIMRTREGKYAEEIALLKEDIKVYDEILLNWKTKAA